MMENIIYQSYRDTGYDYESFKRAGSLSLHQNDDVLSENIDLVLQECRELKTLRVDLFRHVAQFLESVDVPYFISDGTALATYRDGGVMIPHDDDTDVSILEENFMTVYKALHLLPAHVGVQTDCEYTGQKWIRADGSEVPYSGDGVKKFIFYDKRDFTHLKKSKEPYSHAVFTDLYTWSETSERCISNNYRQPLSDLTKKLYPKEVMFPMKKYTFEGFQVWGPNDIKRYCEIMYGYLGRDAMWDAETELYVKRPVV